MMCQRIGLPPISIIGLGLRWDSSLIRVPRPPARITAFILSPLVRHRAQPSCIKLLQAFRIKRSTPFMALLATPKVLVLWRFEGDLQETRQLGQARYSPQAKGKRS